jgi:hypothetical protein
MIFSTTRELKNLKATSAHAESTGFNLEVYKKYPSRDTLPLISSAFFAVTEAKNFCFSASLASWTQQYLFVQNETKILNWNQHKTCKNRGEPIPKCPRVLLFNTASKLQLR